MRPYPTLMGRILPGPINYRVGYGFKNIKKKKPEAGLGWVRVLIKTKPEPELEPVSDPTRLYVT